MDGRDPDQLVVDGYTNDGEPVFRPIAKIQADIESDEADLPESPIG